MFVEGRGTVAYRTIKQGWIGNTLTLGTDDGTIAVDPAAADFRAPYDEADAEPIDGPLPEVFRDVLSKPSLAGSVYYREYALRHRDPVELQAVVRPIPSSNSPYRSDARKRSRRRRSCAG